MNRHTQDKSIDLNFEFLTFYLSDNNMYAIDVKDIYEVVPNLKFREIPKQHKNIKGIVTIRKETFSIIDINSIFHNNNESKNYKETIVTDYNNKKIGLLVKKVLTIKKTDANTKINTQNLDDSYIKLILSHQDNLIQLIDLHKICNGIYLHNSIKKE